MSPDRRFLAVLTPQSAAQVVDPEDGSLLFEFPSDLGDVSDVAFSPDAELLATVTGAGTLTIWRTADWKVELTLGSYEQRISYAAFAPDGEQPTDGGLPVVWSPSVATHPHTRIPRSSSGM